MKRILPYLLLNILISALTMWIVLCIWQKFHPPVSGMTPTSVAASVTLPAKAESTLISSYDDQQLEITLVVGAGDPDLEVLTLKNTGKSAVSLAGWTISDSNGFIFTFPVLTVYPGGAFQLFSRSGVNTAIELFAGSTGSLWQTGSVITLKDPSGKLRQQFTVP